MHHSSSEVGKFATVFENYDNVETPVECELRGTPPKFLEGTMLCNGPGMFQIGNDMYKHWFDGLAYPQRYHFQDGKLFYSAKFIETNDYMNNINNRTIMTSSFGTYKFPDPCKRIYGRFETKFDKGDADSPAENPSVSFRQHGDGIYACTESPILYRIDPDSLSILGRLDMSQYVCVYTYTAHSNSDYEGNVYNIGTKFLSTHPEYIFTKTMNPANNPNAKNRHTCEDTRIVGTVKSTAADSPCYYHSFGMTQNHFVLLEGPVRISLKDIATRHKMKKSYNECMFYDPSLGTNVFVVDQRTGKQTPITYKASSFFTFHHANAFEKDGNLIVDYCRMRKPDIFQAFSLESMRKGNFLNTDDMDRAAYLARMVIPLSIPKDAKVSDDLLKGIGPYGKGCSAVLRENNTIFLEDAIITDQSFEFPRYNYDHYNLREYRYVYGSSILKYETNLAGIVKADLIDRMNVKIWHRENQSQLCAEPVFMPDPNGKEEDDGIVVCPVMIMNGKENPFVLVLNAKDLKEMCRYIIPQDRIPFGFHSMFVQRPRTH